VPGSPQSIISKEFCGELGTYQLKNKAGISRSLKVASSFAESTAMRCKKSGACAIIGMVAIVFIAIAIGSLRGCMYSASRGLQKKNGNPLPPGLFGLSFGQDAVNMPSDFESRGVSTCACGVTESAEYGLSDLSQFTFGSARITNCVVSFLSETLGDAPRWALYRIQFDIIPTKNFLMSEGVDLETIKIAIEEKYGKPARQTAFAYFWECANGVSLEMKKGTLGIGLDNPLIWTYRPAKERHWVHHRPHHQSWAAEENKKRDDKKSAEKKAVFDDL